MSAPCRVTGGEHDWKEGGARDHGRYHCARCQSCLYVEHLIHQERTARAEVAKLKQLLADVLENAPASTTYPFALSMRLSEVLGTTSGKPSDE